MAVEYDLVIIGSTPTAICAAALAAHLKARVALVQQSSSVELIDSAIVRQVGHLLRQHRQLQDWDLWPPAEADNKVVENWPQMQRLATTAQFATSDRQSADVLSTLGIEVIPGWGEFCRRPMPGLRVNGRLLRSRAYLLALPAIPLIPMIEGLGESRYTTADTVLQKGYPQLQQSHTITILGADPTGVELAQSLNQLGKQVQMIVPSPRILPLEDPEAAYLVQAKLEAEGIHLLTQSTVTHIEQNPDGQQLCLGSSCHRAVTSDAIILAMGWGYDLASLNLDAVGVKWEGDRLWVNSKLQTSNPHIYACIPPLGRHPSTYSPTYLARIAVKNALFFPRLQVRGVLPRVVRTSPEIATVGLTEPQMQEHFAEERVEILRRSFQSPFLEAESIGFCKLMVKPNGHLLGASLVGPQASEAIGAIALAMQQRLPVTALAKEVFPPATFAELINHTAQDWHRHRISRRPWQQDCLQTWFDWQRGRLSG